MSAEEDDVRFPDLKSHEGRGHSIKAVLQFCKQTSPTSLKYTTMLERLAEVLKSNGLFTEDEGSNARLTVRLGASVMRGDSDAVERTLLSSLQSVDEADGGSAPEQQQQQQRQQGKAEEDTTATPHFRAQWKQHRRTKSFLERQNNYEEQIFSFLNETAPTDKVQFTGVMGELSNIMTEMQFFDASEASVKPSHVASTSRPPRLSGGSNSSFDTADENAGDHQRAPSTTEEEDSSFNASSCASPDGGGDAAAVAAFEAELEREAGRELACAIRAEANTARLEDYSAGMERFNAIFAGIDAEPAAESESACGLPPVPADLSARLTDEQRRSIDLAAASANSSLVAEMEELERATRDADVEAEAEADNADNEDDECGGNGDDDDDDDDDDEEAYDDFSDAGFGEFKLPSHHRSESGDRQFRHLSSNAKRLSSAVDCSLAFAKYLATHKRAQPPAAAEAAEPSQQQLGREKEARDLAQREKICDELISTERTYVTCLGQLVRLFAAPLRQASLQARLSVTAAQVHGLFANVEIIHSLHTQFLGRLEACAGQGDASIYEEVLRSADFLKIYTEYVSKYDTQTIRLLGELQRSKKFVAFLAGIEGGPDPDDPSARVQSVQSYLIMPVQRVPRYVMMLNQAKRLTGALRPEYSAVCAAAHKVAAIASHVNENKRHIENMDRVLQIQRTVKGADRHLMQPHRRFVRDGKLRMLEPKKRDYTFFLFNDIFMWASAANNFKGVVEMSSARVSDGDAELDLVVTVLASRGARSAWTPARTVVRFGSAAEKAEWKADLERSAAWSIAAQEERDLAAQTAAHSAASRRMGGAGDWFANAPRPAGASTPSKRNTAILVSGVRGV